MDPRYPTGKFEYQELSFEQLQDKIEIIKNFPTELSNYLSSIKEKNWKSTYREGSWNASQVVHHLTDSHVNAYCRIKLALSEPGSALRAYEEKDWTHYNEPDGEGIDDSLMCLTGLHRRMASLLKRVKPGQMNNQLLHPETGTFVNLSKLIQMYAWHGNHHLGHLKICFS